MEAENSKDQEDPGQLSEVASFADTDEPITPDDATAGYPDDTAESGRAQEGTAGPNAAPRHDPPEPANESSR
jgi:hypothetical protein